MNSDSVLFLTFWYPNKNNKSFGIFVKRHAHAVKLSNPVIVLSLNIVKSEGLYRKTSEVFSDELNVETHQIYLESRFNKLLYVLLPIQYFVLKKYIDKHLAKKNGFTILHSNIIFPCGIIGYFLAKKLNCKHVITEHWTKIDKFFRVSLFRRLGKIAYDKAQAITCVSGQLNNTVKKYTTNKSIYKIPNVIDSKEFYFNPSVKKNSVLTFIAVANWGQHKNPFYFLNALQQLIGEKEMKEFKVVLIGQGPQLDKVKALGYKFQIEYPGVLAADQISAELNKSHIFLHGSDFETFSVIIAEALMCGLPCVVSPVGIAPEVINESNGFVTNNTIEDWKDKILKCYNTSYNNQLISEQLKNKYDLNTVGKLFNELYASTT
jgi:glycosyltransferase involved in cell wall biosynthesis